MGEYKMGSYSSSELEKIIMKYLKQIDCEPDEIGNEIIGQFELHYFDTTREREIMKKLKDASLDPDFASVNSLEKKGYTEDDVGERASDEWFEVTIYPNWNDDMTGLLDDDDNPIEVKSITRNSPLHKAVRSRVMAEYKDRSELKSTIRKLVEQKIKASVAQGEMLMAEDAKKLMRPIGDLMNKIDTAVDAARELQNSLSQLGFDHASMDTLAGKVMYSVNGTYRSLLNARSGSGNGDNIVGLWAALNIVSGKDGKDGFLVTYDNEDNTPLNSQNYRD